MNGFISYCQTTFAARKISYNILEAQEVVRNYHREENPIKSISIYYY